MDVNLVIYYLACFVFAPSISLTDVCLNYTTLNSTILKTDNAQSSRWVTIQLDWYRYTGTTSGVIATSCPTQRNACGAKNQIWIEGPLPTFGSGIQKIPSCVQTDRNGVSKCCGLRNTLEIANCNGFFVYQLTPTAPGVNYCFNATAPDLSTVTMPQTTTVGISQDTTSTMTTLPLTTQTRYNTTTVQSTITVLQTTTVNNTLHDATTALPSTLTTQKFTTQIHTTQSHTQNITVTHVANGTRTQSSQSPQGSKFILNHTTGATAELMLSTSINKALPSKTNQQSTEPQPLIGIVTGSVVGCVVVVLAVTAAVYHFKKFRGHQKVNQAHHDTVFDHCPPDMGIRNTKFNVQLLHDP